MENNTRMWNFPSLKIQSDVDFWSLGEDYEIALLFRAKA